MKRSFFYRIFKLGAFPLKLKPVLEAEEIIVSDEGMSGWLLARDVKAPGKRFVRRAEGFLGCLAVTKKRLICFSFRKCQMNISLDDPGKLSKLYVNIPQDNVLSVSFDSSAFHEKWTGMLEFQFKTEKAGDFKRVLTEYGARDLKQPGR